VFGISIDTALKKTQFMESPKPRLLVIETDEMMQFVNVRLLERQFNVTQVDSTEKAIEALAKNFFDLVITDLSEDYFTVSQEDRMQRLRAASLNKEAVYMIHGLVLKRNEEAYLIRCGYTRFFMKPLNGDELRQSVDFAGIEPRVA
jgi:DNA-binding NtrC family response regulator